jgi:lysophospholipase L1-like esterase
MNRRRWSDIGAIALAFAITIGIAALSCSSGVATPAATPPNSVNEREAVPHEPPLALFIGDSYTAGTSSAEQSYACRVAARLRWLCALSADGGTGFVSGGDANRWVDPILGDSLSFSERIPHLSAKYDPDLVVLDGGRDDTFASQTFLFDATVLALSEVRRAWPQAKVIVIRPRLLANPADTLGFDDDFITRLLAEPDAAGAVVIDPFRSLVGTDTQGLLGPDGIHPNQAGEDVMTKALNDALLALGVTP